ncbi:MAG TPA: DUF1761 domain-containing protein [Candidatus Paceibacterota bacterium]
MFFGDLNYVVIIIAAIVGMGLGIVWHAPFVFGKLWLKYNGWTPEHLTAKKAKQSMIAVHSAMTLATLLQAFILAGIFHSLVIVGFGSMLLVGLCVWAGFVVPAKIADYLYGGDSWQYFLIEAGYQLVAISLMSLIIGIFG